MNSIFSRLKNEGVLLDCYFNTPDKKVYAHKIILSKQSEVLCKFIMEKQTQNVIEIPVLKFMNSEIIDYLLRFLYGESQKMQPEILLLAYLSAVFYGFTLIQKSMENVLLYTQSEVTFSNNAFESFGEACLSGFELFHGQNSFDVLNSAFNKIHLVFIGYTHMISYHELKDIKQTHSIPVMSHILKRFQIRDEEKLRLLDDFYSSSEYNDFEKSFLSNVVQFGEENSFNYILNYKCEWLLPSLSRKYYCQAISNRRKSVEQFRNEINSQNQNDFSRLVLLSKLSVICESNEGDFQRKYDLFDSLSTLWGAIYPINVAFYGLINVESSTPLTNQFNSLNVVEYDRIFMAQADQSTYLSVNIPILDAFRVDNIVLKDDLYQSLHAAKGNSDSTNYSYWFNKNKKHKHRGKIGTKHETNSKEIKSITIVPSDNNGMFHFNYISLYGSFIYSESN